MAATVDTLTINRWQLDWLLTAVPSRATAASQSMADDVMKQLPRRLERVELHVPTRADGLVFIDRLCLDREIGSTWNVDAIAERVIARFAQQLSTGLASGTLGVVYRDRAEFLACFIVDAHAGGAREDWRYAEFRGLEALPFSNALRTLARAEPAPVYAALQRLDGATLDRVLGAVNDTDADGILAAHEQDQFLDIALLDAAAVALASHPELARAEAGGNACLRLVASLARTLPSESPGRVIAAVKALGALRATVVTLTALQDPLAYVALIAERAPEAASRLAPLFARDPDAAAKLLARLAGPDASSVETSDNVVQLTRFGGALMLLGLIDDLRLRFDALPACMNSSGQATARLLLATHALGEHASRAFDDGVLRRMLDVGASPTLAQAHQWCDALSEDGRRLLALDALTEYLDARDAPAPHAGYAKYFAEATPAPLRAGGTALLRAFAIRIQGFAASSPQFLLHNFLTARAHLRARGHDRVAHIGAVRLDSMLRMTRFRSLAFELGDGSGRVLLEEPL